MFSKIATSVRWRCVLRLLDLQIQAGTKNRDSACRIIWNARPDFLINTLHSPNLSCTPRDIWFFCSCHTVIIVFTLSLRLANNIHSFKKLLFVDIVPYPYRLSLQPCGCSCRHQAPCRRTCCDLAINCTVRPPAMLLVKNNCLSLNVVSHSRYTLCQDQSSAITRPG